MTRSHCAFEGNRDEMLVAYLYDDIDPAARSAFDSHLAACAACGEELAELQAVRSGLAAWAPPGIPGSQRPAPVFDFAVAKATRRSRVWGALAEIPTWAQVAAALLVFGVAAGIANVEVKYDRDGFAVRTGWSQDVGPSFSSGASGPTPDLKVGPTNEQPWRADLAALEQQLRADMRAISAPAAGPSTSLRASREFEARSDADVMRRVRALIDESERNQRRELALRVAEVAREVQAQRVADLQRIQRSFSVLENTTGGAIVRHGVLLNNLAVKVSQQQ